MNEPRTLQTMAAVLPIASASLYLLGLSFHIGYLATYGLDESLFPLSADRALFNGFLALVTTSIPAVLYALTALLIFVVAIALAAGLSVSATGQRLQMQLRSWLNKKIAVGSPSNRAIEVLDKGSTVYAYATGAVLIPITLILIAALAGKSGTAQAQTEITQYQAGLGPRVRVTIDTQSPEIVGRLVACSERHCAYWTGKETLLLRHDYVHRVSATATPLKAASAASITSALSSPVTGP